MTRTGTNPTAAPTLGPLLTGLCDDAAVFPPGNAPAASAVPWHFAHQRSGHADLVGPFVFPDTRLEELPELLVGRPGDLAISLTVPAGVGRVPDALGRARAIDGVRVVAVEVGVPDDQSPDTLFAGLAAIGELVTDTTVFVEVPRGSRRTEVLARLAGTGHAAKFRTGGITADAYPDEAELAAAIDAVTGLGIAFKATAGLHHAVRNTDPATGFDQHGFLNVLLATHLAAGGADRAELIAVLADRDGGRIADRLGSLRPADVAALRTRFLSFGTCSIAEPLADLTALGLTSRPLSHGVHA
ncbi:hypothetical protein GCM10009624_18390 [Gordonia sinesedis]